MKTIIVHIGTSKTGTTSIQCYLDHQRRRLAEEAGLELLDYGLMRHSAFGESFVAHFDLLHWLKDDNKQRLKEFSKRLDASRSSLIVVSCESFYFDLNAPEIERLRALLTPHRVKVLCYLRREDLLLESGWKQQTKAGFFERTAAEHYRIVLRNARSPAKGMVNYYRKLMLWLDAFGRDAMLVRLFERRRFIEGDLLADFFSAIGAPSAFRAENAPARVLNPSIPSELCEVLAIMNKRLLLKGSARYRSEFIDWLRGLHDFQDPPIFGYEQRLDLLAEYEETDAALFETFLPEIDPPGFDRSDLIGRENEQPFQMDLEGVLAASLEQSWRFSRSVKPWTFHDRLRQLQRWWASW
jgi:hypothetical protein